MNGQASIFETELFGLEQEEDLKNFLDIDRRSPNFSRYAERDEDRFKPEDTEETRRGEGPRYVRDEP